MQACQAIVEVWENLEFMAGGGYHVCHRRLKDRQDRTLSTEDIVHYQKTVVAISEAIRIIAEIDAVIEEPGEWPAAFQAAD
mgnify:CR=1 FL=1|jgi:hypothetical protein